MRLGEMRLKGAHGEPPAGIWQTVRIGARMVPLRSRRVWTGPICGTRRGKMFCDARRKMSGLVCTLFEICFATHDEDIGKMGFALDGTRKPAGAGIYRIVRISYQTFPRSVSIATTLAGFAAEEGRSERRLKRSGLRWATFRWGRRCVGAVLAFDPDVYRRSYPDVVAMAFFGWRWRVSAFSFIPKGGRRCGREFGFGVLVFRVFALRSPFFSAS